MIWTIINSIIYIGRTILILVILWFYCFDLISFESGVILLLFICAHMLIEIGQGIKK